MERITFFIFTHLRDYIFLTAPGTSASGPAGSCGTGRRGGPGWRGRPGRSASLLVLGPALLVLLGSFCPPAPGIIVAVQLARPRRWAGSRSGLLSGGGSGLPGGRLLSGGRPGFPGRGLLSGGRPGFPGGRLLTCGGPIPNTCFRYALAPLATLFLAIDR